MEKRGKKYCNAEITVDYNTKKVKFNYPQKGKYNENLSFSALHPLQGCALSFIFLLFYFYIIFLLYDVLIVTMPLPITLIRSTCLLVFWISMGGIMVIVTKYVNLLVFRLRKESRENYPLVNAYNPFKKKWKVVDFRKKTGKKYLILGNKLIFFDYRITLFEYKNLSENKIIKVETKSIEGKEHKGEHYDFIAVFTFDKPLKRGVLLWR